MHCSTVQGKTAAPLFKDALQTKVTACLCHCNYTHRGFLFTQVCSCATPMHCRTGQGKTAAQLFSAALQNRLTACLCHCNYTHRGFLFTQVCSDATPMHCRTGQGKTAVPLFSANLQTRLTACVCHRSYTQTDLLLTQVCSDATPMQCSTGQGKTAAPLFKHSLQIELMGIIFPAITPMETWSSLRCAVMQHKCAAALVRARQLPSCSVLLCKQSSQHACATAIRPMEIWSSHRCAVMLYQCTEHWSGQDSCPIVRCCSATQAHSMLVPSALCPSGVFAQASTYNLRASCSADIGITADINSNLGSTCVVLALMAGRRDRPPCLTAYCI